MPTLLLVSSDSSQTGAPTQVLILAQGLRSQYQITVCCPDGWLKDEVTKLGLPTTPWPTGPLTQQLRQMAALYNQLQPDLIHCHGVRGGIVSRLAARPAKSRVTYTEHLWTKEFHLGSYWRQKIQLSLLKRAYRQGDWVVAVSEAVRSYLVEVRKSDPTKVSVIYGAIRPLPPAKPSPGFVIGTLGSLTPIKGIPTLLEAVAKLLSRYPTLECRIGGAGPQLGTYQQLATKLGVAGRCRWLSEIKDAASFLGQLKIYVQPSVSEAFGLAAGEAMSAGVPVVVSRVGGLPELVGSQPTGLLFPAGDATALAEAISKLCDDRKLYQTISEAGRKRAAEFSLKRMLDAHLKLYAQLLTPTDAKKA